jgi:thiamine-monophosphate kinase
MSELELLKWIRERTGNRAGSILVDTGDDAAVLKFGRERVLLKTDSVVEGVHFEKGTAPEAIGYKALARPLSDIAAMGGVPVAAVAAAVLPSSWKIDQAKRLHLGMEKHRVPIVGGDVCSHRGPLSVSVTVLGDMVGTDPVLRKGAKPGDLILVTGPLGGSIKGKHLAFAPRLELGRLFANRKSRAHAMIDISDGLARDLGHVCEASGVGAELEAARIPVSRGSTLEGALYDGEDYELLAAFDPKTAWKLEKAGRGTLIGRIIPGSGLWLADRGGRRPIEPKGYEHRLK